LELLLKTKVLFALGLIFSQMSLSSEISYRSSHPIAWMHGLPSGESPGWKTKRWFLTELQHGNYWNTDSSFTDLRSGDTHSYFVDFEQLLLHMEAGFEVSENLSLSVGLPVVYRLGGILDRPLDDWHVFVGADRFSRPSFPENKNNWSVKKNGQEQLASSSSSGLGIAVLKAKYWFYQPGDEDQALDKKELLGAAVSAQLKLPLRGAQSGLSTGNMEASVLGHFGSQLFSRLYFWASAGLTKKASNPVLEGWPVNTWAQMYETWFEVPLAEKWDFIFQLRYESPLVEAGHLDFQYTAVTDKFQDAERAASGWNGLTAWRGSDALGFRYHIKEDQTLSLFFQEDFALGGNDGRKNFLYVHGSPDVALVAQFQTAF